jgi:hypothetical protein
LQRSVSLRHSTKIWGSHRDVLNHTRRAKCRTSVER